MIEEQKHVAVMSLFRVRFTYTVDYVPFSRIALVKATSPLRAKEYVTDWLNANGVVLPSFQYRSVTRCTDFSYIIDPDAFPTRLALSSASAQSSAQSPDAFPTRLALSSASAQSSAQSPGVLKSPISMEDFLEKVGEFNEPNQPSFF